MRRPISYSKRPTTRLHLEILEDRLAPATRLVVPAGMADGTTSFASLAGTDRAQRRPHGRRHPQRQDPGRKADLEGRDNFVGMTANGATTEHVITLILGSPEYALKTGSDTAFLESLYTELLGREADAPGLANWMGTLATQGRAAVIQGFVNSLEFRTLTVQNLFGFQTASFQNLGSLFLPLLHRTTAPSAEGVSAWVNSGLDLLQLADAFASSEEYFING